MFHSETKTKNEEFVQILETLVLVLAKKKKSFSSVNLEGKFS